MELPVIRTDALREGTIIVVCDPRRLVIGMRQPTEYESIVMDGFAKAHPWFRDPLRSGSEAWKTIESVAKEQGHILKVRTRGAKS